MKKSALIFSVLVMLLLSFFIAVGNSGAAGCPNLDFECYN